MNVLQGEAAALDALFAFARPLAMTDAALADVEPIPAAHAYCAYMTWLAMYASDAELAGALLVNFAGWGANCGRMSRALRNRYGFSGADTAFFDQRDVGKRAQGTDDPGLHGLSRANRDDR